MNPEEGPNRSRSCKLTDPPSVNPFDCEIPNLYAPLNPGKLTDSSEAGELVAAPLVKTFDCEIPWLKPLVELSPRE